MMHFVPKDTTCIADIVEMVVAELHGENAIAEIDNVRTAEEGTSSEMDGVTYNQRTRYLVCAGEEISELEDAERWDGAAETIRQALSLGGLTAYVLAKNNLEQPIPKPYWDQEVIPSITIHRGTLQNSPIPELSNSSVFVYLYDFLTWLRVLVNPGEQKPDKTRGRPHIDPRRFKKILNIKSSEFGGDKWISRQTNQKLAEQTIIWMGNDPTISDQETPKLRAAEGWIATMRENKEIPSKS